VAKYAEDTLRLYNESEGLKTAVVDIRQRMYAPDVSCHEYLLFWIFEWDQLMFE
jgi:hypothetical protein